MPAPAYFGPYEVTAHGRRLSVFTAGAVAKALGRSRRTLVLWEKAGILPTAGLWRNLDSRGGRRRLYPAKFVEDLTWWAEEMELGRRISMERAGYLAQELRRLHDEALAPLRRGSQEETPDRDGRAL